MGHEGGEGSPPPSARVHASLLAHPHTGELILFGGECTDSKKYHCYNDLYLYNPDTRQWRQVQSQRPPGARCSHQAAIHENHMYVYGGESRFKQFDDLWRLDLDSLRWEELRLQGGPTGRSGHRMCRWKDTLCMFGGFQDAPGDSLRYLDELWLLQGLPDPQWRRVAFEGGPAPRSGCCLMPHGEHLLLFGGYSTDHGPWNDLWAFEFETGRWQGPLTPNGVPPSARSGISVATVGPEAFFFGGVTDSSQTDLSDSVFHSEVFRLDLDGRRWLPTPEADRGGPCPRMHSMLVVQGDHLFLYGGMVEKRKRECTLGDLFALQLDAPAEWNALQSMDRPRLGRSDRRTPRSSPNSKGAEAIKKQAL